jgi:uncharacterized protein (DUF58 family)
MLRRVLGELLVGFLIAGIALAVAVPAAARLGYTLSFTYGLVITLSALAISVIVSERRLRGRSGARQSS